MSISFFDDLQPFFHILGNFDHSDLGGLFCILVNFCYTDHLVDHQKLNIIQKWSISFFDDLGDLFLHFGQLLLLRSLGQSSEVEHNPKMSISFFKDFFQSNSNLTSVKKYFFLIFPSANFKYSSEIEFTSFLVRHNIIRREEGVTLANSNLASVKKFFLILFPSANFKYPSEIEIHKFPCQA